MCVCSSASCSVTEPNKCKRMCEPKSILAMFTLSARALVPGQRHQTVLCSRRVGRGGGCVGCDRTPPRAEKVRLEVTCSAENVNL